MNQQAKIIIAALAALAVVLMIGLVVSLANDDDDFDMSMSGNHSMGMMQAMGNMNSNAMLEHMREVLGEDGFQRMLGHMREHRSGAAMPNGSSVDDMMHRMMDGMMQQMPADRGGNMPMSPR
ncbi:MAG TPA: hypothetical protein VJB57_20940 [Dehalococcoidia bacterium]|nr:hypothetical protein [Dehalococcoidia bacterium]